MQMQLQTQSGKQIQLADKHFLAEGGEGKLFAVRDKVYKVYHDSNHLMPAAKLLELQQLDFPGFVRPLEALYRADGQLAGYSMYKVPGNPVSLARLFTSSYWQANNIDSQSIIDLLQLIREKIVWLHGKRFLQVDGNEFNYLVTQDHRQPWLVDLDSYQTPGYPATGIMWSIKDFSQSGFSEGSDWYSFAVVSFQLFTGIHPYKGKHPDYLNNDIEKRLRDGVSVFDSAVRYPSSVRDFSAIPRRWLDWYKNTFIKGEREPAPDGKLLIDVSNNFQLIRDGKTVEISKTASFASRVSDYWHHNGHRVIRAGRQLFVGTKVYDYPADTAGVILDIQSRPYFLLQREAQLLMICGADAREQATGIAADRVFVFDNRAFVIYQEKLIELTMVNLNGKSRLMTGASRNVLPHALKIFNGLVVQNVLGKTHLMLPVSAGNMPVLAVPELDSVHIIEARLAERVGVFLVADNRGVYSYYRFFFNSHYTRYRLNKLPGTDDLLNFIVLDKGRRQPLLICLPRDRQIEISRINADTDNQPDEIRLIEDDQLKAAMRLSNDGNRAGFFIDNSVYSIRVRQV